MFPKLYSSRAGTWILGLVLFACTIAVYYPARNGGFLWDDDDYVTKNSLLTAPDGLRRIWFSLDSPSQYFPLVYTTFRIERHLWGLNPSGYHWVNILLHATNAFLVWKLLARLKVRGAWAAAMIFALHPVQVESVAWITERKNVLMAFFFLLTLHSWIAFSDNEAKRRWIFYVLALASYVLALSAKTTACTLPAAILSILWLQKKAIGWRRIGQLIPFFVLGLGMGLVTVWWERYHVGTRGPLFAFGPIERLLIASHAVWFYLAKLFWPAKLTFIYPQWNISMKDPFQYGWLVATAGACGAIYYFRRVVGRCLEVAAFFFVATLSPLLGFIMLYTFRYTFVADHYQYLASLGPIALVAAGFTSLGQFGKFAQQIARTATIFIVIALGVATWRQSATYADVETLWRTTVSRNPTCWMGFNNLGIALVEKGEINDAIGQYRKSLQFHADYGQAHYNLGLALLEEGQTDEATAECRKAIALQPNDPDARVALGNALLAGGSEDEAIAEYFVALKLRPDYADGHYNLGNALMKKGETDAAAAHFEQALRIQPDLFNAHLQLGNIALERKNWRVAVTHYELALSFSPRAIAAQNNLAWVLASSADLSVRNGPKAVQLAEQARQSSPEEDPILLHTLAAAYAQDRQFDKAIAVATRALNLASKESNSNLSQDLQREINLYQNNKPYQAP